MAPTKAEFRAVKAKPTISVFLCGRRASEKLVSVMHELFTIGHSTHEPSEFVRLLRLHGITAVGDVRSSPFSQRLPQFNRPVLEALLKKEKIRYVFLGEE